MRGSLRLLVALMVLLWCGSATAAGPYRHYKMDYSGAPSTSNATMAITFDRAVAGTYSTETGAYTMTVNGSPTRVTDGTWPAGLSGSQGYGWTFDGSTDYLSRTDDGTFDPAGDFSVMAVVTPDDITKIGLISGKWKTAADQRSWAIMQYNASAVAYISDDGTGAGGHLTTLTKASAFSSGMPSCLVFSYDYVSDGSSVASVFVDELSAATTSTADGPAFGGNADLTIGAYHGGAVFLDGKIHHVAYWDGVALTEAQARSLCRQWRGVMNTGGGVVTTTAASPPAVQVAPGGSGTQPFLIDMPANTTQVGSTASGSGGIYGAAAIDNLAQRSSFETWAGAGDVTGWAEIISGSASIDQETTNVAHGGSSVKLTVNDGSSWAYLRSTCLTGGIGSDLRVSAWVKKVSGTASYRVRIREYDTATCTTSLADSYIVNKDIATDWTLETGTFASGSWNASTSSYYVELFNILSASVFYLDAVMIRSSSLPTDAYCGNDVDATSSCSASIHSIPSPISANGTIQIEVVAQSPFDGSDLTGAAYVLTEPSNPFAANGLAIYLAAGTDEAAFVVGDSAGDTKFNAPNVSNWTADTSYTLKASKTSSGSLRIWWNSAWQTTSGGTGAGTRSASQSTMYLGGNASVGHDIWIRDLKFFRRLR